MDSLSAYSVPGMRFRKRFIQKLNPELIIKEVIANTCEEYGVDERVVKSKTRRRSISEPRQVMMFILWQTQIFTLISIADVFDRDHTTVIHAKDNIMNLCGAYPELLYRIQRIKQNCGL